MSAPYDVGAWQIKEDGFGYPSIYGTDEDGNPGDLVAHTFADHERLIVCAPAMLAALYQYRDDLRYPPAPDSVKRRLAMIEALIAKATIPARDGEGSAPHALPSGSAGL